MQPIEYIYDIIEKLRSDNSRNFKESVTKNYIDDVLFKEYVYLTLEPTLSYYQSNIILPETHGDNTLTLENIIIFSYALSNRELSGNAAADAIQNILSTLSTKSQELLKMMILKDFRAGFGPTIANKVWPNLITDVPYMRFSLPKDVKLDKFPWEKGVYVQEKMDGQYAAINIQSDKIDMLTRNGNPYPNDRFNNIVSQLKSFPDYIGFQLQGEFLVKDDGKILPREIGNGLINAVMQGEAFNENQTPIYVVWDIVPLENAVSKGKYKVPYAERFGSLHIRTDVPDIIVVNTSIVYSYDEAMTVTQEFWKHGGEGSMVKSPDMEWKDAKTTNGFKIKIEAELDLRIIVINIGEETGKYSSSTGSIRVASECGKLEVNVGTGLSDAQRQDIFDNQDEYLNKLVVVVANGLFVPSDQNEYWSLFLPRTKLEVRNDKDVGDDLDRIKSIFNWKE